MELVTMKRAHVITGYCRATIIKLSFSVLRLQRETLQDHDRPCDIRRVRRRRLRVHQRGWLLVGPREVVRRQTATRRQTVPQGNGWPVGIREYLYDYATISFIYLFFFDEQSMIVVNIGLLSRVPHTVSIYGR